MDENDNKHRTHSRLLNDLDKGHKRLQGRIDGVNDQLGQLGNDLDLTETRLRDEVKGKLFRVRETLYAALDKVGRSIEGIKADVKKGLV